MSSTAQQTFLGQLPAKVAPTGTAGALAQSTGVITTGLIIKALPSNPAPVYIGKEGVTVADGMPLAPGDSLTLNVRDPSLVFCLATVGGCELRILGV